MAYEVPSVNEIDEPKLATYGRSEIVISVALLPEARE